MLKSFENVISTMGNSSQITFMVNEEEPPAGCAVMAVSSKCETHIMLKVNKTLPCMFFFFMTCSKLFVHWYFVYNSQNGLQCINQRQEETRLLIKTLLSFFFFFFVQLLFISSIILFQKAGLSIGVETSTLKSNVTFYF